MNALGYRGAPRPPERGDGAPRIAMLGDSFTYGYGVRQLETVPAYLEQQLRAHGRPAAEVLNFGVPGYQIEDMLAQWRAFARRWQPDLVLVYLASGPEDLQRSWCWYSYKRPRLEGSRVPDRDQLLRWLSTSRLLQDAIVLQRVVSVTRQVRRDAAAASDTPQQVLARAFEGFARQSQADATPVAFVTLEEAVPRAELEAQTARYGFPWLDLSRARPRPPRIRLDSHLSARGNRMVAEAIGRWLLGDEGPLATLPGGRAASAR